MTDDIVYQLRRGWHPADVIGGVVHEAADEIERLRAEVARLNTFLHPIGVVINEAVRGD